jgi:hypothetical protein
MAEFALQCEMLLGLGPGRGVVEPEIALLAEAHLLAHAIVVFDRRAAERDIDRLPPGRAHAPGILFAGAEPPAEIDIHHGGLKPALGERHRERASDNPAADQHHVVSPPARHALIVSQRPPPRARLNVERSIRG